MTRAWPWWKDTRDGELYHLAMFATNERNEVVYVLQSMTGGLNLVSPAPGVEGCVIEQSFRECVRHTSGYTEFGYDKDYEDEEDGS